MGKGFENYLNEKMGKGFESFRMEDWEKDLRTDLFLGKENEKITLNFCLSTKKEFYEINSNGRIKKLGKLGLEIDKTGAGGEGMFGTRELFPFSSWESIYEWETENI